MTKLDKLAQGVAMDRRSEALVNEPLELSPRQRALVFFKQREPLRRVASHVERCQEHFLDILGGLDPEELAASVQSG
jgi:hypothetical protein